MTGHTVCGVDEAGRGPVIGPLVLGCVVVDCDGRDRLTELKVRDSKKLTPERRTYLEPLIKEAVLEWKVLHVHPAEIDRLRDKISLNVIEAYRTAEMLISLSKRPSKVLVDAPDVVEENYAEKLIASLRMLNPDYPIPEIISEHHADDTYIEVSAASVLAKVERDRAVEALKVGYGDFGSGYPSDELTQKFIKEAVRSGDIPDFVRRSWSTLDKSKQTTITEF